MRAAFAFDQLFLSTFFAFRCWIDSCRRPSKLLSPLFHFLLSRIEELETSVRNLFQTFYVRQIWKMSSPTMALSSEATAFEMKRRSRRFESTFLSSIADSCRSQKLPTVPRRQVVRQVLTSATKSVSSKRRLCSSTPSRNYFRRRLFAATIQRRPTVILQLLC